MSVLVLLATAAAGYLVLRALVPVAPSPPVRRGAPGPKRRPRVSIVVPARDEERNLPALLASLAALDPAPDEIIVVDDHSRDRTGDRARAAGAIVVTPPELPPGWLGKSWACESGARAATGELLLFTDADTTHAPDSLGRALAALEASGASLVTVVPTHAVVRAWERLQGVFHVLCLVATGGTRRYAIGQYLLVRRDAYEAAGRHAAVRSRIAEDLALAERIEATGGRRHVLVAPGLLGVRMYPEGLRAFFAGWRRSFRDGMFSAGWRGALATTLVIGWLLGAPIAVAGAAAAGDPLELAVALALYAAAVVAVARRQRLMGGFGAASALAYPLFVLAFVAVSLAAAAGAAAGRPVTWRGREIPARR